LVHVSPVGQFGGLLGSLVEQQLPVKHCPPQQTLPAPQLVAVQMHVPLPLQTGVVGSMQVVTQVPLALHVRHCAASQVPHEPPHVSGPHCLPAQSRVQHTPCATWHTQFVRSGQSLSLTHAPVQVIGTQTPVMHCSWLVQLSQVPPLSPQWSLLLGVWHVPTVSGPLVQQPLGQLVAVQRHLPPVHVVLGGQTVPHVPQF
jgi:hypothetical protein